MQGCWSLPGLSRAAATCPQVRDHFSPKKCSSDLRCDRTAGASVLDGLECFDGIECSDPSSHVFWRFVAPSFLISRYLCLMYLTSGGLTGFTWVVGKRPLFMCPSPHGNPTQCGRMARTLNLPLIQTVVGEGQPEKEKSRISQVRWGWVGTWVRAHERGGYGVALIIIAGGE